MKRNKPSSNIFQFQRLDEEELELERASFSSLSKIQIPSVLRKVAIMVIFAIIFMALFLTCVPWQQTSQGFGRVASYDPSERVQPITALVSGRISKWHVFEGQEVKEGDILAEITDNDPMIIQKLQLERDSVLSQLKSSELSAETSKLNYQRQENLWKQGLSSRKEYEQAKIKYNQLLAKQAEIKAKLAQVDIKFTRQNAQVIRAPKDGFLLSSVATSEMNFIKAGDQIGMFAPLITDPIVELFVNGMDVPFIRPGQHVRLRFEGWPAFQFSGWGGVVGTFDGVVKIIDRAMSQNGKMRIIISPHPDEKWPDMHYLRQGMQAEGWVLLNEVSIGYELWRRLNYFPPERTTPVTDKELFKKATPKKKK